MKYTFTARGHKNILATHKKTLEFTKDRELSPDGDCIVGVGADFSLPMLQKSVQGHRRLRMRIKAGKQVEEIEFVANKQFRSDSEIVLRFSEFSSDRTLGFRATKSAAHLDKQLVIRLKDPKQKILVEIEPAVKAVLFDFDNTIEDLKTGILYAHKVLAKKMFEQYGVYEPTTMKLLHEIDKMFSIKGVGSAPRMFDRHLWFEEYFKRVGIKVTKNEIDRFVTLYWRFVIEKARPMPHAVGVLSALKKNYLIAVMSDSDGCKRFKVERAKTVGLSGLIDLFLTSDDVGVNKPNRKFYSIVFDRLGLKPEECVMVGDKPQVDLKLAKELGMNTVWIKYGSWAKRQGNRRFDYVDHEITDLKQLLGVMRQL